VAAASCIDENVSSAKTWSRLTPFVVLSLLAQAAPVPVAPVAPVAPVDPDVTVVTDSPEVSPKTEAPGSDSESRTSKSAHGAVFVHLDSSSPIDLQLHGDDARQPFTTVCSSPCDTYVPPGDYRVAGGDARPSSLFSMADGSRTALEVNPRSQTAFVGGILLAGAGVAALSVAFLWALPSDDPSADSNSNGALALAIAGAAVGATGLTLLLLNTHTAVTQHAMVAGSPWRRVATWRERERERERETGPDRALVTPWELPILSGAF
jgi:hypothetical protein